MFSELMYAFQGIIFFLHKLSLYPTTSVIIFIIMLSVGGWESRAQVSQEDVPKFNSFQTEDGLSNLRITALCQDSLGYLWIGTPRGLNRYNGYEVVQFFHDREDALSLNNDFINSLFLDKDNQLWVGTMGGLNRFDFETNRFIRYSFDQTNALYVLCIQQDQSGELYVGTNLGLGKVLQDKKKIILLSDDLKEKALVRAIHVDKEQNIWVGFDYGKGLARYDKQQNRLHFFVNKEASEDGNSVYCIYQGPRHQLWLGTQRGISLFNPREEAFLPGAQLKGLHDSLSHYPVCFISDYAPLKLWIGTEEAGLFAYDLFSDSISHFSQHDEISQLSSDLLTSFLKDQDGNIWVGTFNHGLNVHLKYRKKFNPDPFLAQITQGKHVSSFLEDSKHNLYIATRGHGLLYVDREKRQVKHYTQNAGDSTGLLDNRIRKLMIDAHDRIWIGLHTGLQVYDPSSDKFTDLSVYVKNSDVVELLEFPNGEILAGTTRFGVLKFDINLNFKGQFDIPFPAENVVQIVRHSNGKVYFAAYYNSIYEYDAGKNTFRNLGQICKKNAVDLQYTITAFEDSGHDLYFGTYGRGLIHYDPDTDQCQVYDVHDGLPSNDILSILEDDEGHLWLSTSFGLSEFDPKEKKFINYYSYDGINGDQFHENAGMKDHEGNFYFGGNFGMTFFNPLHIFQNPQPPQMVIEDLKVMNQSLTPDGSTLPKSIALTEEITLDHRQQIFSIDFLAFDYTAPQKIRYAYKLEGLEKHWNEIDRVRRASYSNLEPGTYHFLLKARNSDGVWNEIPKKLTIHIKSSPWTSIYARIAYVILLAGIIMLVFRFILRMKLMKRELDFEHREREREHAMHQMKLNFFTNISHELRTPLTLIGSPLELIKNDELLSPTSKEYMSVISRNVERLYRLLNQLLDFRKLEYDALKLQVKSGDILALIQKAREYFDFHIKQKQISLSIHADVEKKIILMDQDKVEKMMYNLLSNAIKFTPSGQHIDIFIKETDFQAVREYYPDFYSKVLRTDSSFIEITVRNEGSGIKKEALPRLFDRFSGVRGNTIQKETCDSIGIGLNLTKRMAELHKGGIRAESKLNEWTAVSFVLPADKTVYNENEIVKDDIPPIPDMEITDNDLASFSLSDDQTSSIPVNKKKLLVVEDDPDFAAFLQKVLVEDFQVLLSDNGERGLAIIKEEFPDLIISDVMMSEMSGMELACKLKNDEEICHIPMILLTAKSSLNDQIEGLNTGADAYITKPFSVHHLLAQIHNLLENRAKLHAIFSVGLLPSKDSKELSSLDEKFLHRFEELLNQHIENPQFNINFIATEMGFSRSSFYRKFVGLTGSAPHQYVKKFRLRKAAELIREGNLSLTEISDLIGFSAPSNFSSSFKKEFGVSPKEFK